MSECFSQEAIFELPSASVSKRGFVRFHENQPQFLTKEFARSLVLKQRHKITTILGYSSNYTSNHHYLKHLESQPCYLHE